MDDFFDDDLPLDQPYSDGDLKTLGFDPFEAHLTWLKRRSAITANQAVRLTLCQLLPRFPQPSTRESA